MSANKHTHLQQKFDEKTCNFIEIFVKASKAFTVQTTLYLNHTMHQWVMFRLITAESKYLMFCKGAYS